MTTDTLWHQFRDEIDGFLRRHVANRADAEDLRQQVYLSIHRHLQAGSPPDHVRGWVYRIARNAVIDHRRRRAARPDTAAADVARLEAGEPSDGESTAADPEPVRALAACLTGMVDRLPEPYRSAVRWTELEGVSQRSAAARAGVSLPGMKSRVQRGRAKLREALLACCEVELDARQNPIAHRCRNPACGCSA